MKKPVFAPAGNSFFVIAMIILSFAFAGYLCYLVYDLIVRASSGNFSNATVVQSFVTLLITVFVGGYFSKYQDHRNQLKFENYKSRKEIAMKMIDLSGRIFRKENENEAIHLLATEGDKGSLLFDDDVLKALENFLRERTADHYTLLVAELKNSFRK